MAWYFLYTIVKVLLFPNI
uniref:Uncharacterized protein n=1 Tax=Rhizophora mucronata TaxID=61149 RepID=A0A2P2NJT5_RHIMU